MFVTHEWSRSTSSSRPPPPLSSYHHRCARSSPIIVLCSPQTAYINLNRNHSPSSVLVALLLLLGGVKLNPGPTLTANSSTRSRAPRRNSMSLGLLNVCSTRHEAALIHDIIADNHIDALVMTETWIPSDAPNAIKLDWTSLSQDTVWCIDIVGRQLIDVAEA